MEKELLKQKRKLGFSIGLCLLITNTVAFIIGLIMEKTGIAKLADDTLMIYILNTVCNYVVGYLFLRFYLKKVDTIKPKPKSKMKFGQILFFIVITVGSALIAMFVTQLFVNLFQLITHAKVGNRVADVVEQSNPLMLIGFVAILGPIFEELIYRGLILSKVRAYGDKTAIIYTAILFGLYHTNISQIPFAIVLGLIFGYVVVKTNNIKYSIILHIAMNTITVVLNILLQNKLDMYMVLIIFAEMLCALATVISLPILLSSKKHRLRFDNEGNYEKKNLYKNIGYISTVIIVTILTVYAIIAG